MSQLKLYNYWRSSTSYRTRIALQLKNIPFDYIPVNLLKDESSAESYLALNPSGGVPALVDGGVSIGQSLAIIDYLEQKYPEPSLLPKDPAQRARVMQIAYIVACDMHQFANLQVLNYVVAKAGEAEKLPWIHHWMKQSLQAIEALLQDKQTGKFCHGDTPTLADVCLIPQLYAAKRFEVDLTPYPKVRMVDANCLAHPAFIKAHPDQQPDAVKQ